MSVDLDDIKRLKVTPETIAWLESEARNTGKTKQEVMREVLHEIALKEIKKARLLLALAPSEGKSGDSQGRMTPRSHLRE